MCVYIYKSVSALSASSSKILSSQVFFFFRFTHVNESCDACKWVMSHVRKSHIARVKKLCHTFEWARREHDKREMLSSQMTAPMYTCGMARSNAAWLDCVHSWYGCHHRWYRWMMTDAAFERAMPHVYMGACLFTSDMAHLWVTWLETLVNESCHIYKWLLDCVHSWYGSSMCDMTRTIVNKACRAFKAYCICSVSCRRWQLMRHVTHAVTHIRTHTDTQTHTHTHTHTHNTHTIGLSQPFLDAHAAAKSIIHVATDSICGCN